MPELPEVETVRRGLAPAMEGARFKKVETRRKDLRWPFPKDFIKRLEGQKVEGVGRRAKYLTVDVSSGDVLLMHLGMSGSFRVVKDRGKELQPGSYHFEKGKLEKHDHVVFTMSNGSVVTFNDPRRFGMMKIVPRSKIDEEPLLRWIGPEPLGNAFDAEMLAAACAGKKTSLKAALLDQTRGRRHRQYLRLRGAVPVPAFTQADCLDHCRPAGAAGRAGAQAGGRHQDGAQRRHQGGRLVPAGSSPRRRLARRLPAQFPGL